MTRRSLFFSLAAGLLALSLGGVEARAGGVTLADLLVPGAMIEVSGSGFDFWFEHFSYGTSGTGMPAAADVNVSPVFYSDSAGLRFQGAFGSPAGLSSDALIGFEVTSHLGAITDNHLHGDPDVIGGDGSMSVTETVSDLTGHIIAKKHIFTNVVGGVETSQLNDVRTFDPHQSLLITKDIFATSFGVPLGVPTLSVVDQTFSTTIPEPTSLALLGIGLSGLFTFRRLLKRVSAA